ncbi:hypothetical protein DMN91_003090 [Ooceraea biroi]|uniref:Uncharacterized protein n=2 Tax=Ooceraea biroi TaxID=2015173 RepID=A0A3L8DYW4_OOCBI|nr:hypothetical protein DMN91_003090 [Ooceraea biroi]
MASRRRVLATTSAPPASVFVVALRRPSSSSLFVATSMPGGVSERCKGTCCTRKIRLSNYLARITSSDVHSYNMKKKFRPRSFKMIQTIPWKISLDCGNIIRALRSVTVLFCIIFQVSKR